MDEFIEDEEEYEDDADAEDEGEEEEEDEEEPLLRHSALLAKNGMIAMLMLQTYEDTGVIVRIDPREESPKAQRYTDARSAERFFTRSLRTSERNGWTVAWEGEPVVG